MNNRRKVTEQEFRDEAVNKFGPDVRAWKFVCPVCGHIASGQDYIDAGAPTGAIAFSCIGRWTGGKGTVFDNKTPPCNYSGGGLFALNPVEVDGVGCYFELADG